MGFHDDDLRAYLKGDLAEADALKIEEAVAQDARLEERLMDLDPLAPHVQVAFDAIQTPPAPKVSTTTRRPSWQKWATGIAAAAIVLGLGLSSLSGQASQDWHRQVAAYQALYVPDTIATLDTSPAALTEQFSRASAALGKTLKSDTLTNLPRLDLKRAQILGYGSDPLIQIVFEGPNGAPIALCIMARQGDVSAPVAEELSGLAAVHWADDAWGYILIGGQDRQWLTEVSTQVRAVFSS